MAHICMATPKGSSAFTFLTPEYYRVTKDGDVPILNFLLGSHYNIKIDGEMSVTSSGPIANDTVKAVNGSLEITGRSTVNETLAEKTASFVTFMTFFPRTNIFGHAKITDATVTGSHIQRFRYLFEDLATTDRIFIDLEAGAANAVLKLSETVGGVTTTRATYNLTAGQKEIFFELDFLEEGVTKFYVKPINASTRTRIFNGTLNADIFEAKVSASLMITQTTVKTVSSDVLWIMYPNLFVGYDVPNLNNKVMGRIRVFDTNNQNSESQWIEVFSGDHKFIGQRVIENGLVRIRFLPDPSMEVFGWNTVTSSWNSIGRVRAVSNGGVDTIALNDVVFERFNDSQVVVSVKYGLVEHQVDIKRGWPSVRIVPSSTRISVLTSKQRFAVSVDNTTTDIPDFNHRNTDDANRGNPLNLVPPVNPFIFTNNNNATTGLERIDDNWYSWYNLAANDMVGFLGVTKRPIGLQIRAVSATQLDRIDWIFDAIAIVCIGVLRSDPNASVNGVPIPFLTTSTDSYVKWRANEGIFGANQREFLRKKR